MADATSPTTVLPAPVGAPPALRAIVRERVLDADLGSTVWVLAEGGVPVVVAGPADPARRTRDALLSCLPAATRVVTLAGIDEDFAWLPQAPDLGWPRGAGVRAPGSPAQPASTCIVADLRGDDHAATWGEPARIAVRAASVGYQLAATVAGSSLEDVFRALRAVPNLITDDELTHLGVVLVVGAVDGGTRVTAAHYVRPLARDEHGHVQRLGPAVLATHDPTTDRFEHFGWGITPELAARLGVRAGDLELEIDRRRALLEPPRPH